MDLDAILNRINVNKRIYEKKNDKKGKKNECTDRSMISAYKISNQKILLV